MKNISLFIFLLLITFTTLSQIVLLEENFENTSVLPPGWDEDMTVTGNHWIVSSAPNSHYLLIPYHGNIVALNEGDNDENLAGEYLISPNFDLTGYTSAFLSVDIFFKAMSMLSYTETAYIEVSIDNGNTWNTIKTIEGYFNWHKVYADISDYCGNDNVTVAIKYSDNGAWLYGIGIDNMKVFVPYENDAALTEIKKMDFVLINDPINISGIIQNAGTNTINSLNINYCVNGGITNSQGFSSLNLLALDTMFFEIDDPWIPTTQEPFNIEIRVSDINGILDDNPANNTQNMNITNTVSSLPEKGIFLEVFGATWCTLCPHAGIKIAEIKDSIDNLIVSVIHINDLYSTNFGNDIFYNYHLHPGWLVSGLIDRYNFSDDVSLDMDRYLWPHYVYKRADAIAPVEISLLNNYDPDSRELNIFLSGNFLCDLTGDYRFNCYIIEDSIQGEQSNCLTNPDREPYCFQDYWIYDPPGIISNYLHMNTLRAVLGGPWGTEGSLPEYIYSGSSYGCQYNYTLPDLINEKNLKIIGIIQKYETDSSKCTILNAKEILLNTPSKINRYQSENLLLNIFPNPADTYIFLLIDKEIIYEISDIYGRNIMSGSTEDVIYTETLKSGYYIIKIYEQTGKLLKTEKLIIQ